MVLFQTATSQLPAKGHSGYDRQRLLRNALGQRRILDARQSGLSGPGSLRIFRYLEETLPRAPRPHLMIRELAEASGQRWKSGLDCEVRQHGQPVGPLAGVRSERSPWSKRRSISGHSVTPTLQREPRLALKRRPDLGGGPWYVFWERCGDWVDLSTLTVRSGF